MAHTFNNKHKISCNNTVAATQQQPHQLRITLKTAPSAGDEWYRVHIDNQAPARETLHPFLPLFCCSLHLFHSFSHSIRLFLSLDFVFLSIFLPHYSCLAYRPILILSIFSLMFSILSFPPSYTIIRLYFCSICSFSPTSLVLTRVSNLALCSISKA